jgi:hypothetical protein
VSFLCHFLSFFFIFWTRFTWFTIMASLAVNPKSPSSQKADHFVSKRVRDAFFRKFCMQSGK